MGQGSGVPALPHFSNRQGGKSRDFGLQWGSQLTTTFPEQLGFACTFLPVSQGFLATCADSYPALQQPVVSRAGGSSNNTKAKKTATLLTPEERVTHALNRLTFGPRPGDAEKVRAMGVDRWIVEMQLQSGADR